MENISQWTQIAALEDLADIKAGESLTIEIESENGIKKSVVIVKGSLKWYAIDNLCSHDNGPLDDGEINLEASSITCGRHGAKFNLNSGEVIAMPAVTPIESYEIREENGFLEIKI